MKGLYKIYELESGEKLFCYELTNSYAFMCPYTISKDPISGADTIKLNIRDTKVYHNFIINNEDVPKRAISSLKADIIY